MSKPIRLWPGAVLAIAYVVLRFIVPPIFPAAAVVAMFGGLILALAIVLWWLFFSRAPWLERLGTIAFMAAAVFITMRVVDISIRTGMMGFMLPVYSLPALALALVIGVAVSRGRSDTFRRASIAVAILIACAVFTLLRTEGIKGGGAQLTWRWTPTAEERLLAQAPDLPVVPPPPSPAVPPPTTAAVPLAEKKTDAVTPLAPDPPVAVTTREVKWSGFRGPNRSGVVHRVHIGTDWITSPPRELWRKPIGPGWSSFAVAGDFVYTQEQRGEDEIVACYRMKDGSPAWRHRDRARFWESNAGAGPRGTPTIHNDRVYAFGATGILNVLDAATGARVWSRNVAAELKKEIPTWGFSSSPLVIGDLVIVAASGQLAAFEISGGQPRWTGPRLKGSYSSPHRVTIDGVPQVVLLTSDGATSVAPADGKVLWQHAWGDATPIVQPTVLDNGDILISAMAMTSGLGIRRLSVRRGAANDWIVEEKWTSTGLKPYFNDYVVHEGHAYGFDGNILSSIDLADGKRKWKGGRYGEGQLVLLAEQDLLLVVSEDGDIALVRATPDGYAEVAKMPAIEGKTWNHPVVVGDVLLIRNGEEMAAFRLPRS